MCEFIQQKENDKQFWIFQEDILGLTSMSPAPQGNCLFIMPVITILCCCSNSLPHNVFITETAIATQIIHMPYIYFSKL